MNRQRRAHKQTASSVRQRVMLAQRGVDAEAAAHDNLKATYRRFMAETNPEQQDEAGRI